MSNTTEYTCEVVTITKVENHFNADKLDIVKFSFADGTVPDYQCIASRGDFVAGSSAVYISSDALVPIARPEFKHVTARLDYKTGSDMYRLRAAKIRGAISTGMVIPHTGNQKPGTDMSDVLGVVRYISQVEKNEIETVKKSYSKMGWFQRTLTKILKYTTKPYSIPDYSVTSLRKAPGYFQPNEKVIYTEKIHGSNIRFGKVGGRVYIGSHRVEKSDSRPWLLRKLFPVKKAPGWYGSDVWSAWFYRVFDANRIAALPNNVVFYGELFGKGIQDMDYGLDTTDVRVFDAWDVKHKQWMNYSELFSVIPYHINMVNTSDIGLFDEEYMKRLSESPSGVGAPGVKRIREGTVVRSIDWSKCGKHVSEQYLTRKQP